MHGVWDGSGREARRSFGANTVLVRQSWPAEAGVNTIQTRSSSFVRWLNTETGRAPPASNSRVAASQSRLVSEGSFSTWIKSSTFIWRQLIASLRKQQGLRAANQTTHP